MRSHRRRFPVQHVLLACGVEDVEALRAQLADAPVDAYGQVLVELPAHDAMPDLDLPWRFTAYRIVRDPHAPGAALVAAVDAWTAEWMPGDRSPLNPGTIWVGAGVSAPDAL